MTVGLIPQLLSMSEFLKFVISTNVFTTKWCSESGIKGWVFARRKTKPSALWQTSVIGMKLINCSLFMGSEISLPFSYESASGSCSEPDKSSTELYTLISTKSISVIASNLSWFLPSAFFSFDVPAKHYAFLLYPFCPKFNRFYYTDQGTQIII